jgi:hypothetical protein
MAEYVARRSGRQQSVSGNPIRRVAQALATTTMSSRGLVVDGVYHVDSIVRPGATPPSRRNDPRIVSALDGYSPVSRPEDLPSLKIRNLRIPQSTGWVSPAEFGVSQLSE